MPHAEIAIFFFLIAMCYASAGFGGGSSYIAILALYSLPIAEIRLVALICNIIVVTSGTILFIKNKQVNFRKTLPLLILSVPMAFLGAKMQIREDVYFIILGCSLLIASLLLWIKTGVDDAAIRETKSKYSGIKNGLLGGSIGFLSGIVGIGGGIFLSPILNLTRWDTSRKIAATASLFILINSISGIAGQNAGLPDNINYSRILILCVAVFLGGQIGSRFSLMKFNLLMIRRITAVLVLIASIEILTKHLSLFK